MQERTFGWRKDATARAFLDTVTTEKVSLWQRWYNPRLRAQTASHQPWCLFTPYPILPFIECSTTNLRREDRNRKGCFPMSHTRRRQRNERTFNMQSCEGKTYTPFQMRAFPFACILGVYTSLLWGRTVGPGWYFIPLNKENSFPTLLNSIWNQVNCGITWKWSYHCW